jgi:hypothetical protein
MGARLIEDINMKSKILYTAGSILVTLLLATSCVQQKHEVKVTRAPVGADEATIYVGQNWPVYILEIDGEPGPNQWVSSVAPPCLAFCGSYPKFPPVYNSGLNAAAEIRVPEGRHLIKAACRKVIGTKGLFNEITIFGPDIRYFDVVLATGSVANVTLPVEMMRQMKARVMAVPPQCDLKISGALSQQVSAKGAIAIIAAIRTDGVEAWNKFPPPGKGQKIIRTDGLTKIETQPASPADVKKGKAIVLD